MLSRPAVNPAGAIVGVIQVAQSARFLDARLGEVRTLMEVGTILTLVGAGTIGWLLVGRALRPITNLTAAAGPHRGDRPARRADRPVWIDRRGGHAGAAAST